ncbi:penicillin-binding protein activator [Blastochloris tepida]|uniref:Penicillin-binding protein activator n=1 Tax=Blastochloris tepida TaxID=2233851 RepID=A0A348G4P9_9HYPH|nr:penicillin-binding protein activator [Blastochloris tepida]BBF94532.1 penicillin-binding protein activator [Blastochloris tepida]
MPGTVSPTLSRRTALRLAGLGAGAGVSATLGGCQSANMFGDAPPAGPAESKPSMSIGTGSVRVGLILPLTASGNAGSAAQSLKNAAELAIAEFNAPDISLIVKDDGGSAQGGQQAAEQAISEGCEIILGPLFAVAVRPAGQIARQRGVPVIAFSTDAQVASRGVHLLSFLPASDVDRIVGYAAEQRRKSFAALLPDTAYGQVVEAEFQQAVAKNNGRVLGLARYAAGNPAGAVAQVSAVARQADCVFVPDGHTAAAAVVNQLRATGLDTNRTVLIGTGLWDDPAVHRDPAFNGAWYAAPDNTGFRGFAQRYRAKFGSEPVRTASLSYDAVSLVAALVKTQGAQRFSEGVLTNPSGFSGIDGIFRFKSDGTSERGLAVHQIGNGSSRIISPSPRSFTTA